MNAELASTGRLRSSLGPLFGIAALTVFLFETSRIGPQYDDAYISYRYAQNLVDGYGLVFNPGEYVEGFSNFLWTLLVAAGLGVGLEARTLGHLLGVAGGAGTLLATWAYARAGLRPAQAPWAAIAVWLVLASPVFARWTSSGMETPLFSAAVVTAFACQARGRFGWAAFAVVFANLVRPEGALVAAAVFGFRLLETGLRDRRAWLGPLVWAAVLIALTVFRLAYYGDPLPNTYYAKVGGVAYGVSALAACFFLIANAGPCVFPAIAAVAADRRWWPGATFAAVLLAYGVSIGSGARYLLPVVPLLAVLGVRGARVLCQRRGPGAWGAVLAVIASFHLSFFGWGAFPYGDLGQAIARAPRVYLVARDRDRDAKGEKLAARRAQVLRERGEADVLVATGAIGAFGYFSRLPILDILGLTDAEIARSPDPKGGAGFALPGHRRSNPDYVFSRRPDYILIGRRGPQRLGALVTAPDELRQHPDLERYYEWDAEVYGYRRLR